jgi:hypothetical protein
MYCFHHPDFSLLPNPDDPTTYRGVAKTQEGIKALLAVWGTPKDDPDRPLCVFSWVPTLNAVDALKAHFPDVTIHPLESPSDQAPFQKPRLRDHLKARFCALWPLEARHPKSSQETVSWEALKNRGFLMSSVSLEAAQHRALWDAQKDRAWLKAPPKGAVFHYDVLSLGVDLAPREKVTLTVTGNFPPRIDYEKASFVPTHDSDGGASYWEEGAAPCFWLEKGSERFVVVMNEHTAARFRYDVLSCALPEKEGAVFGAGSLLKEAYRSARTRLPGTVLPDRVPPWCVPHFVRTAQGFFERPNVSIGDFFTRYHTLHARCDPQALALFRAQTLRATPSQQQAAFAFLKIKAPHEVPSWLPWSPLRVMEHVLEHDRQGRSNYYSLEHTGDAFKRALLSEDAAFFEALAPLKNNATWATWCLSSVEEANEEQGKLPALRCRIVQQWDRHAGFQHWDTPEGMAAFTRSFAPNGRDPPPFRVPARENVSRRMIEALDDPVFLKALENSDFWARLEREPHRHPEWEALLERRLLSTLSQASPVSRPFLSFKDRVS